MCRPKERLLHKAAFDAQSRHPLDGKRDNRIEPGFEAQVENLSRCHAKR